MPEERLRVLVIGTLPPIIGGASVLLQQLVDGLRAREDVDPVVLDTGGIRGGGLKGVFRFLRLMGRVLGHVRRVQVVALHAASGGMLILGPLLRAVTWAARRPFVLRSFGGTYYPDRFGPLRRAVIRLLVHRVDLFLVETRAMIRIARAEGITRVAWYPNSRSAGATSAPDRPPGPCRRLVYLGQVRPYKGIAQLIAAGERMDHDIDVYGPFWDGLSEQTFQGCRRVHYRGEVPPAQVVDVLRSYDVLVLPTYFPREGYPGVVLEAYRAGLPVIASRTGAIPEIVDDTCGILVTPRDVDELHAAMKALVEDESRYQALRQGVLAKRQMFDADLWTERFVDYCRQLARSGVVRPAPDDSPGSAGAGEAPADRRGTRGVL